MSASPTPFTPAPLGLRLIAGLIDGFALVLVAGSLLFAHLKLFAAIVPLWTIAGIAIALLVLPVWRFGRSIGLALVGLRITRLDGEPPDLLEIAARELIGRGILAASFLGSFIVGVVSAILGLGTINLPAGIGFLLFIFAGGLLGLSAMGQMAMLLRPDRRSFADMIGRVVVAADEPKVETSTSGAPLLVDAQPEELEADEEWLRLDARRQTIRFAISELVVVVVAAGVPYLNSVRVGSINPHLNLAEKQQSAELDALRRAFEANPAGRETARDYIEELRWAGQGEAAQAAISKHREARAAADGKREAMLLGRFDKAPDWDNLTLLLELYEDQENVVSARGAWEKLLTVETDAASKASYGIWLYQHDLTLDAVDLLQSAVDEGYEHGDAHAYLGWSLMELDRAADARAALLTAVERDPDLSDDVADSLAQLDAELGPRPKTKKKRKGRRKPRGGSP